MFLPARIEEDGFRGGGGGAEGVSFCENPPLLLLLLQLQQQQMLYSRGLANIKQEVGLRPPPRPSNPRSSSCTLPQVVIVRLTRTHARLNVRTCTPQTHACTHAGTLTRESLFKTKEKTICGRNWRTVFLVRWYTHVVLR